MAKTWREQGLFLLKKYWGYTSFRPGQQKAIDSVVRGTDTLVLFPTGGGKSICYQLPALMFKGLTVVITPLISLMEDQIDQLESRGIPATFLNSSLPVREVEQRLVNARNGMYRLIYCSPERLETPAWQYELENLDISMIAVDEAHCISEWGHDFRKSYRNIRSQLDTLPADVRWIALTATATPEVREDILKQLQFKNANIIIQGFDRPNLKWWVINTEKKDSKIGEMVLKAKNESGLIYAGTRRKCDELTEYLEHLGLNVRAYHAGLDYNTRREIQQAWQNNTLQWVVATNAFGMGIDKENCRYVFHYEMPQSLEAYYQQAGRAGRDGKPAFPIILYKEADYHRIRKIILSNYPRKEELQKIYDAVCDSLGIAVGEINEGYQSIDYEDLSHRNGLSVKKQAYGMIILDRYGLLRLLKEYTPRLGVRFILSQEGLLDVLKTTKNRQKAVFIDRLMRVFGPGAFMDFEFLDHVYLAEKLEWSPNSIIKGLEVLKKEQVLEYTNQADRPLVSLNEPRYGRLPYTSKELERHCAILLKKLDYMNGYVTTRSCRSAYIRKYFGEKNVHKCAICDNCMTRESSVSKNGKDLELVMRALQSGPSRVNQLNKKTGLSALRLRQVLELLLREKKIETLPGKPESFQLRRKRDS